MYRDLLRHYLRRFEASLRRDAERNLQNAMWSYRASALARKTKSSRHSQDPVFVGVHVRRGDIVEGSNYVDFGYRVATVEYLQHAMDYFVSRFPGRVMFIVASDNATWVHDNFPKRNDAFVYFLSDVAPNETLLANQKMSSNLNSSYYRRLRRASSRRVAIGVPPPQSTNKSEIRTDRPAMVDFVTLSLCNHTIQTGTCTISKFD